jgi:hypothetical protein
MSNKTLKINLNKEREPFADEGLWSAMILRAQGIGGGADGNVAHEGDGTLNWFL